MSDSLALFGGMLFGKHEAGAQGQPQKDPWRARSSGLVGGMVGMIAVTASCSSCATEVQLHIGWCVAAGPRGQR